RHAAGLRHHGVSAAGVAGPACAGPGPGVRLPGLSAAGRPVRPRPWGAVPGWADLRGEPDPAVPAPSPGQTHGGWRWRRDPDDTVIWTAPTGHEYQVPIPPTLDDPDDLCGELAAGLRPRAVPPKRPPPDDPPPF
ncbi:MAG TPA: hypothetical protein VFI46_13605, partial [Jiangellaceae bacterium]|nr:hypothetical protein [Jiangellaceae bacterium]